VPAQYGKQGGGHSDYGPHAPASASRGNLLATISCGQLALAVLKCVEDIAIAAPAQIMRHAPYVCCRGHADYADMNGWGIEAASVAAPSPGGGRGW
jgi:hypothetical protein